MFIRSIVSLTFLMLPIFAFSQTGKPKIANVQTDLPKVGQEENSKEEAFVNAQKDIYIGRPDKAIEKLEELYKTDRTDAAVAFELAKLYAHKNDFLQLEKYSKVIETNAPSNAAMISFLAKYYTNAKKYGQAEYFQNKLMALGGIHNDYRPLIQIYKDQNKIKEAIALLDKQIITKGYNYEVGKQKYDLLLLNNDYNAGLTEFQKLIKLNKYNKDLLKKQASVLIAQGKENEANALYKDILQIDAEDVEANLAILSKGDKNDKPNAYLMSLLPLISNSSLNIDSKIKELRPYIENLAKGGNQDEKATIEELGNKLIQAHPTEAKAYALHGDILLINGKTEEAITKYEKAMSYNNKVFAIWEQLMYSYLETGRYEEMSKLANKAIDFHPNEAINFFFASIGSIYVKKDCGEGISLIDEGIVVAGGNVVNTAKLKTGLANAYICKKDFDNAIKLAEEAIVLSKNKYSFAYEILGNAYEGKSDLIKAKEAWRKSTELGNKNKSLLSKAL
jgi:tetratricopeptide (TPR) repeat protein